jgi:hypothetical protein
VLEGGRGGGRADPEEESLAHTGVSAAGAETSSRAG